MRQPQRSSAIYQAKQARMHSHHIFVLTSFMHIPTSLTIEQDFGKEGSKQKGALQRSNSEVMTTNHFQAIANETHPSGLIHTASCLPAMQPTIFVPTTHNAIFFKKFIVIRCCPCLCCQCYLLLLMVSSVAIFKDDDS